MGMSDKIESFITELLKDEENEWLELKRNELASFFNCVPSQINYVIATRFSPERGFAVESRRGGGGYVRIRRIACENPVFETLSMIGTSLTYQDARTHLARLIQHNALTEREAQIMLGALNDNSILIPQPDKDKLRAIIMKNMLTAVMK